MLTWPTINNKRPRQRPRQVLAFLLRAMEDSQSSKPPLRVVQVGANDGRLADPLFPYFTQFGWKGWLFEPHPVYFRDLSNNYAELENVKTFNFGISDQPGEMELFHLSEEARDNYPRWLRGCASISKERFEAALSVAKRGRDLDLDEADVAATLVTLRRLDDALKAAKVKTFDALVVDVEGHEVSVLNSFDLSAAAPKLVVLEANGGKEDQDAFCIEKMKDAGLTVFRVGDELVGVRESEITVDLEKLLHFLEFPQF